MDLLPTLLATLLLLALPAPTQAATPVDAAAVASADRSVTITAALRFRLDAPYRYSWRADRPQVDEGWLLVVEVDPALARPTQGLSPVLMVGSWPVERLSWSVQDPHMVVIVPAAVDLAQVPVFWGPEALPEQLDAAACDAAAVAARQDGGHVASGPAVAAARLAAGPDRVLADRKALYAAGAELVMAWVPDQADRVAPWLNGGSGADL